MSRYSKIVEESGEKYEIAWGWDRPLGEYFFQKFLLDENLEDMETIFSISNRNTIVPHPNYPKKIRYSNMELLAMMRQYFNIIPKEHVSAIRMDLSF